MLAEEMRIIMRTIGHQEKRGQRTRVKAKEKTFQLKRTACRKLVCAWP